jgi:hypothetical protein
MVMEGKVWAKEGYLSKPFDSNPTSFQVSFAHLYFPITKAHHRLAAGAIGGQ